MKIDQEARMTIRHLCRKGMSNREVARLLGLSEGSVRYHRNRTHDAVDGRSKQPLFEREFVETSYGFRPERGGKDALREVDRRLKAGHVHVVDADLRSYFDSIPHPGLMDEVRKYIGDGRVLALIEAFFKQDIVDGLAHWSPETGIPQGAVISPLLSNVHLHSIDVAMRAAGFPMVRYADDFVIMCRSHGEAQAALGLAQQLCAAK